MTPIIRQLWLSALVLTCFSTVGAQDSTHKKPKLVVFPAMTRSVETSWAFGGAASYTFRASKTDSISRTSSLQFGALYSLRKQLVSSFRGTQYLHNEKWIFNEQVSFSSFPDKFWGLGKNTLDGKSEDYSFKQMYVYLHFMKKIAPRLFGGLLYEYQRVWDIKYQPGGLFDQQQIDGRYNYHVSGLGLSLTYDSRNHAFYPTKGFFAQGYFNHFSKVTGSQFPYTNFVLDFRKFMPAGREGVFAAQAWLFGNIGKSVPLRSQAAFGGDNTMRGYYQGRFRDLQQFVLQGEYRRHLYKKIGIVAFASCGNVAHDINALNFQNLKYSFGGGLRYALNASEKLNLRIDYGIGKGQNSGFYFQLAEAF
ncbi:MAG: BamA/TamA family outer membrane protein [Sediminibacterium sp.]|nr:BamA/TamA family outer membrane protein [uncultured Sediminibacterium sp.]